MTERTKSQCEKTEQIVGYTILYGNSIWEFRHGKLHIREYESNQGAADSDSAAVQGLLTVTGNVQYDPAARGFRGLDSHNRFAYLSGKVSLGEERNVFPAMFPSSCPCCILPSWAAQFPVVFIRRKVQSLSTKLLGGCA